MANPLGISGCICWYAADQINGVSGTLPNGTPVMRWTDLSDSGNHLTPLASSNLPIYYTNVVTGLPAISFNGTSDYLQIANNQSLNINSTDNTFFAVFNSFSSTSDQSLVSIFKTGIGVSALNLGLNHINASGWNHFGGSTTVGASSITNNPYVYTTGNWYVRYDAFTLETNTVGFGSNGTSLLGGIINSANTTNNTLNVGYSNIGGASPSYFSGYIAEIIGFNRKLTSSELTSVNTYLIDKYIYNTPASSIYTVSPAFNEQTDFSVNLKRIGAFGATFAEQTDFSVNLKRKTFLHNAFTEQTDFQTSINQTVISSTNYNPDSISGLCAWYRASSIGLTTENAPVQYWYDDSGSGNYLYVPTGNSGVWNFPTYHNNMINGWPTVRFTNSQNDYLQMNDHSFTKAIGNFSSKQLTAYTVFISNDISDEQSIFNYTNGIPHNTIFDIGLNYTVSGIGITRSFGFSYTYSYDSGIVNSIVAKDTNLNYHMYDQGIPVIRSDRFRVFDGEFVFGVYGADLSSGILPIDNKYGPTTPFAAVGYNIMTNDRFYGDIAEIIIYSRKLQEYEHELVKQYLLFKYMPGNVGNTSLFIYSTSQTGIYEDRTLYTQGSNMMASGNTTLYTGSASFGFSGVTLYEYGSFSGVLPTTLYTLGQTQQFPPITLYTTARTSITGTIPLYMGTTSYINNNTTLFVEGAGQTVSGAMPLYLVSRPNPSYTGLVPLFVANTLSSTGVGVNGLYSVTPLYLEAGAWFGSMPLVVYCPDNPNPSAWMPLYLQATPATGNPYNSISLFVSNSTSGISSGKKFFIQGDGSLRDGYIATSNLLPLVINHQSGSPGNIPLYVYSNALASGGITLSISGSDSWQNSISLTTYGAGFSGYTTLYVNSQVVASGGISLYASGLPSINSNVTMFSHGF